MKLRFWRRRCLGPMLAPLCTDDVHWNTTLRRASVFAGVLLLASLLALFVQAGALAAPPEQPAPGADGPITDRQRHGFVIISGDWPNRYDLELIGAGWYSDFTMPVCRQRPGGMDRALGVHIVDGVLPPNLGRVVDNHPGTTWLIGNEPDCIYQMDVLLPGDYARVYHDAYHFIKGRDPTAMVAAGGIVQPTPIRLAWLDAVLSAYHSRYGGSMPVDVWHIHNIILNEIPGEWGCDVPLGVDPALAVRRSVDDHDDMGIFVQGILDFRQWMADRGYAGLPLMVSEYGIIMPGDPDWFPPALVNAFMSASFDWMSTAIDPVLGDPSDGNHLVQRWAWYSLDDRPWDWDLEAGANGNLFDPDTREITVFGRHFGDLTAGLPPLSYVDLVAGGYRTQPSPVPGGGQDVILYIEVKNPGTLPAGGFEVTLQYHGPASGTAQQRVDGLAPQSAHWVPFTLPNLPVGAYDFSGQIDAEDEVAESDECANGFDGRLGVPMVRVILPAVSRGSRAGQAAEPVVGAGSGGYLPPVTRRYALPGRD